MNIVVTECPPNVYVEALAPCNYTGARAFQEVTKVEWGHKGGFLIPQDGCP